MDFLIITRISRIAILLIQHVFSIHPLLYKPP
ncbi:hypothetical protein LINPERPRIM_LOCUS33651 [Linum perenne]